MQRDRTCRHCCKPLVRRSNEKPYGFQRRQHCGWVCSGAAKARAWVSPDGPPWTEDANGCWVWNRRIQRDGYGKIALRGNISGPAHRWTYEQIVGPIPDGLDLDHLCRNRSCVNPAHLEPVTGVENIRRGANCKLTVAHARQIRDRFAAGGLTQTALAAEFGVSRRLVGMIVNGKLWKE